MKQTNLQRHHRRPADQLSPPLRWRLDNHQPRKTDAAHAPGLARGDRYRPAGAVVMHRYDRSDMPVRPDCRRPWCRGGPRKSQPIIGQPQVDPAPDVIEPPHQGPCRPASTRATHGRSRATGAGKRTTGPRNSRMMAQRAIQMFKATSSKAAIKMTPMTMSEIPAIAISITREP